MMFPKAHDLRTLPVWNIITNQYLSEYSQLPATEGDCPIV